MRTVINWLVYGDGERSIPNVLPRRGRWAVPLLPSTLL